MFYKVGNDLCYIGCFYDSFTRDMQKLLLSSTVLTIELCITTCISNNYSCAGVQAG